MDDDPLPIANNKELTWSVHEQKRDLKFWTNHVRDNIPHKHEVQQLQKQIDQLDERLRNLEGRLGK